MQSWQTGRPIGSDPRYWELRSDLTADPGDYVPASGAPLDSPRSSKQYLEAARASGRVRPATLLALCSDYEWSWRREAQGALAKRRPQRQSSQPATRATVEAWSRSIGEMETYIDTQHGEFRDELYAELQAWGQDREVQCRLASWSASRGDYAAAWRAVRAANHCAGPAGYDTFPNDCPDLLASLPLTAGRARVLDHGLVAQPRSGIRGATLDALVRCLALDALQRQSAVDLEALHNFSFGQASAPGDTPLGVRLGVLRVAQDVVDLIVSDFGAEFSADDLQRLQAQYKDILQAESTLPQIMQTQASNSQLQAHAAWLSSLALLDAGRARDVYRIRDQQAAAAREAREFDRQMGPLWQRIAQFDYTSLDWARGAVTKQSGN